MDILQDKLALLRTKLDKYPVMQKAEDATSMPKEFLVLGGGSLLAVLVIFGIGIASLTNLVGFVYPAFKSFQAIETNTKSDDTQWLVYWVIFALFSIIEVFVDILLYWIPFYYSAKLAFLLWAMLPQTKGSKFLYDSFLKDLLKQNESKIDDVLNQAKKTGGEMASEFSSAASDMASGSGAKKDT